MTVLYATSLTTRVAAIYGISDIFIGNGDGIRREIRFGRTLKVKSLELHNGNSRSDLIGFT